MDVLGAVGSTGGHGNEGVRTSVSQAEANAAGEIIGKPQFELLLANAKRLYVQAKARADQDPSRFLETARSTVAAAVVTALNESTSPEAGTMRNALKTLLRYQSQLDVESRKRDLGREETEDFHTIAQIAQYVVSEVSQSASDGAISAFMNAYGR